jgi:hypothetical protein
MGNLVLEISKTKIPLERPGHRRKDNIETDLTEVGSGLNLSGAGRGRVAGFCEQDDENEWPSKAENLLTTINFWRRTMLDGLHIEMDLHTNIN